jgi:KUP system potassium uptake protein
VVTLALVFQSADKLGDIYGVAVTATFVLNTLLFLAVARFLWGTQKRRLVPIAALFLTVEVTFFASNIIKIEHGAWLSLALALVVSVVMFNWRRGQTVVTRGRTEKEGPLTPFLDGLEAQEEPPTKVPGVAVYLHPARETTPLALRIEVENTHTFPKRVVIVSVDLVSIPNVDEFERFTVERIGGEFNVFHVTVRAGYHDSLDVPAALRLCRKQGLLEVNLDLEHASYFVSRIAIKPIEEVTPVSRLRKKLFVLMARNAASPIDAFQLPSDKTVIVGSQVAL